MPQPLTVEQALDLARELLQAGKAREAGQVCDRILKAEPKSAAALHLSALASYRRGDLAASIEQLRKVVRLEPDAAEPYNDLGNVQQVSGALEEAVFCYHKALRLRPGYADAHRNLASALRKLGRVDEAVRSLETAVTLNPDFAEAAAQLVHQLKQRCQWNRIGELTARLIDAVERDAAPVNPFVFLSLDTTASQQLQCARQWHAAHYGVKPMTPGSAEGAVDKNKITLGYLSADYQEHAITQLMAELIVLHDRSRFRVIGYSCGQDDGSAARQRVAGSFDSFVDLETASHDAAAARIRKDGVDILIDLMGYTANARPEIPALRPAPVQVNYLGYPGTTGSDSMDYILVDPFVVPMEQQPYFTERLVHLPDCYQMNDRRRPIAPQTPTRADCGLPDEGFVFCCLSAPYKITPGVFDIWMRLLREVPGSVLWLLDSGAAATTNLRQEAEARLDGGAERLVFAPSLPNPQHLARLSIADLFLDTLPYNSHTVASDALWAGCAVVTCAGTTFPSRVAGSILRAARLPELVTTSLEDYEALALRLAREPGELQEIRRRLRSTRMETPLFDSTRLTRHIEAAYEEMWRRHREGLAPSAFAVASLPS